MSDELDGFQMEHIGDDAVALGDVALDGVGQSVHAGGGSQTLGHGGHHIGVDHSDLGEDVYKRQLYRGAGDYDRADAAATHGMALSVLHGILCTLAATAVMPGFLARFTADGTIVSMLKINIS